jgi:hypothetical protein
MSGNPILEHIRNVPWEVYCLTNIADRVVWGYFTR